MGLGKTALLAAIFCILLDAVWIGFLAKKFYLAELSQIGRIENGGFSVVWWAAILVYVCLGIGIAFFVNSRLGPEATLLATFVVGALFGLVTYGTYDMTNHATLKDFGSKVAVIDMCWGGFMCGTAATLTQLSLRYI